jgi:hypothetical protein
MTENTLLQAWKRGFRPALVVLILVAAGVAVDARGADPPLASIGNVTTPGDAATASGTVGSNGKTDACVNDDHSGANPSTSSPNGPVQINDDPCTTSGTTASGGTGTQARTQAAADASATRSATSTAGVSGSTSTRLVAWVFASEASGLRIARVQYLTNGTAATKHFRVVVTLRDLRGRLVRHAIVSTGRVAGAMTTVTGVRSTFTNRLGQARLALPVAKSMLGKQLLLRITARTPSARARTIGSVLLPRLGPH